MKQFFILSMWCVLLLCAGCKDDDGHSYPASSAPEIRVERDELYSLPGRKFIIKARLADDLGLRSLNLSIPDFFLDKDILFPTDELLTEYDLAYEFLAPAETTETETYTVTLLLTDVSGNNTSKELTLHLNGDFTAPQFTEVLPEDGTVKLLEEDMQLEIFFKVSDASGLDKVSVKEASLGIDEQITLGGETEYVFHQTYSLPSEPANYELVLATTDKFVEPNQAEKKIKFSVSSEMSVLYLADVPKGTDLTADVFGVPIYYETKRNGIFTFKYYADRDGKEIYFLGQESSFTPHCFGAADEEGRLKNSPNASPVILPTKGYYEIEVDTKAATYTATPYIPSSTAWDPDGITLCGNGIEHAGWDPNDLTLQLSANPENPYVLEREVNLLGTDVAVTVTSPNWGDPFWRLDANGIVVYLGGNNYTYPNTQTGTYKFSMDTETNRAMLVKESIN